MAIDYKKSIEKLSAYRIFFSTHPQIEEKFQYKGYNVLQMVQQSLMGFYKGDSDKKQRVHPRRTSLYGVFHDICLVVVARGCNFGARIFGPKAVSTVIYTIDRAQGRYGCDFRIEPLYTTFETHNISYVEIFHTTGIRVLLKNMMRRKRWGYYLPGFLPLFARNSTHFSKDEISVLEECIGKEAAAMSLRLLRNTPHLTKECSRILRRATPASVWMIDDTRHYYPLVLAAKEYGCPSYALQHGHFTKYHVGWIDMNVGKGTLLKPDILFVWSEYWKKELLRLGSIFTQDEIRIASPSEREPILDTTIIKKSQKTTILIPYEIDAPCEEVQAYVKEILRTKSFDLICKFRPDIEAHVQMATLGIGEGEKVTVVYDESSILDRVGIVLGVYSTFLYKMIEYGKPIGVFSTSMDFGYGLILNSLADEVRLGSLEQDIGVILSATTPESLTKKQERLSEGSVSFQDALLSFLKSEKISTHNT